MAKPILEARNLSKTFSGNLALDSVDLDLFPGEIHASVGQNGSREVDADQGPLGQSSAAPRGRGEDRRSATGVRQPGRGGGGRASLCPSGPRPRPDARRPGQPGVGPRLRSRAERDDLLAPRGQGRCPHARRPPVLSFERPRTCIAEHRRTVMPRDRSPGLDGSPLPADTVSPRCGLSGWGQCSSGRDARRRTASISAEFVVARRARPGLYSAALKAPRLRAAARRGGQAL
jgi:hypothetical protein